MKSTHENRVYQPLKLCAKVYPEQKIFGHQSEHNKENSFRKTLPASRHKTSTAQAMHTSVLQSALEGGC